MRVEDILAGIEKIKSYTHEMTYEQFSVDSKTVDAVIRNLEIIGEATKRLSDALKQSNPEIRWRNVAGLRDVLIHDYMGVDLEVIWNVIVRDLPELKKSILECHLPKSSQ